MKNRFLLLLLACTFYLQGWTQQASSSSSGKDDTEGWTLQQCIEHALANNLTVKRGNLNVESFDVDLDQAKMSRLPSINAGGSYGYSWGRGLDPVSNSFVSQEIRSSGLNANGSLPVFNGLRIHNAIKQADYSYEAAEQDLAKTKNDVMLTVADLFINVVFNKELVDNARFQLTSSQQQLDRTKKQVAAGALPKSEELNLDAQVATNEVTLVQQENALMLSMLRLKQALLIPSDQPFDVVIPELTPEDLILDQTRDEIYGIAKQTMPEIKAAEFKIKSSKYGVRAARGNLYPRLSLNGGLNTNYSSAQEDVFFPDEYGFNKQVRDNIYRTLGFQLSIPILNGFTTRASIRRAVIQNQLALVNAVEADQTLRQNVETAYNNALAAAKTYNSSRRQVDAREEAFRMMEQRFGAGAANSFEFQVSQNDLFRARTDLTRAKYDFIFRKKVLDFYQGKPLEY